MLFGIDLPLQLSFIDRRAFPPQAADGHGEGWVHRVTSGTGSSSQLENSFSQIILTASDTGTGSLSISELLEHSTGIGLLVLVLLLGISAVSWAIIFLKWNQIRHSRNRSTEFIDLFWEKRDLDKLAQAIRNGEVEGPAARVFQAGYGELLSMGVGDETSPAASSPQWSPNLERALQRSLTAEQTRLENHLVFLATTGSASPFIGLFGTVWGIMTSFQAIGQLKSADLAVVAPGIAEALIATAVGLFAAIPAVVAYNFLGTRIRILMRDLNGFGADLLNAIQRHFYRKGN